MTEWILKIIAFFKGDGKNEFREDFKTAMIGYRRVNKSLVDHLELIEDKLKEGEKKEKRRDTILKM